MQTIDNESPEVDSISASAGCPIDHTLWSERKTTRASEPGVPVEHNNGRWHIRGFEEARAILRSSSTKQAGFGADFLERIHNRNAPILYQEGKVHQQQRKQTARFFTPKAVSSNYRQLMERLVDQLIARFQRDKRADLSHMSLTLAVQVAAEVVGLTNSRLPGMDKRLDAFFKQPDKRTGWRAQLSRRLRLNQWRALAFFFLDVKPAITARKRQPKEDVISHLLSLNYTDAEILTECMTYAAAGMATTREFISLAAWHFIEHPALRAHYLAASEADRQKILEETLRLEPVVGNLYRRATEDIHLESNGKAVVIPQGELVNIDIYQANRDETAVGEHPDLLCPARTLRDERIPQAVLGFGDGHHRCPGSYIAIQESDIFLQRLLALDGLRIECPPTVTWNDLVTGYELRHFILTTN